MANIQAPKRIRKEDFPEDYQELIDKMAYIINNFFDEVYFAFQGNIDFTNISQQLVNVNVSLDGSGNLIQNYQVSYNLPSIVRGVICVKAENLDNSSVYPTSQPFVSFTLKSGNIFEITNVSGLQNSSNYKLTLILIS